MLHVISQRGIWIFFSYFLPFSYRFRFIIYMFVIRIPTSILLWLHFTSPYSSSSRPPSSAYLIIPSAQRYASAPSVAVGLYPLLCCKFPAPTTNKLSRCQCCR